MDFKLTEEQIMIQDMVKKFALEQIKPQIKEIDSAGMLPDTLRRAMAELALFGAALPDSYGGAGLDKINYLNIAEALGYAGASVALSLVSHHSLVAEVILKYGSEEVKQAYLPVLAGAEKLGAFAFHEPDRVIFDIAAAITKQAEHYLINGTKHLVVNARNAGLFLVWGLMDSNLPCALLVPAETPGITIEPQETIGTLGAGLAVVHFDEVRVPLANIIGKEGEGKSIAELALMLAAPALAAISTGILQASLDDAIAYARQRRQFGEVIANFPMVQDHIIEMAKNVKTARLLNYAAVMEELPEAYMVTSSLARLHAAASAMLGAIDAIQVHGGYGYSKEYPIERYFRDARMLQSLYGSSDWLKTVISNKLSA
jgi:alkylation response protein AidB-like acyl-CoA dehydrogenase